MSSIIKFTRDHTNVIEDLPFAYCNSPIYFEFGGYVLTRNGEDIPVLQDSLFPHEFPAVRLPKNKLNWENFSLLFATEQMVQQLKDALIPILLTKEIGREFYYKTSEFISPQGGFKKRVEQFQKMYQYTLHHEFASEKILVFYEHWKKQRLRETFTFEESEDFFLFCLRNLKSQCIKQVYVVIDGKLVGFAWGIAYKSGNWIGLHLKVDYSIKGLSRFLHQERAKLFADLDLFTLGTGAHEKGIDSYKQELGPVIEKKYYYVLTGNIPKN